MPGRSHPSPELAGAGVHPGPPWWDVRGVAIYTSASCRGSRSLPACSGSGKTSNSPAVAIACQTVCPESTLCVRKRTAGGAGNSGGAAGAWGRAQAQEAGKQGAEQPKRPGPAALGSLEGSARASLPPAPLPGSWGSANPAPRKASLCPCRAFSGAACGRRGGAPGQPHQGASAHLPTPRGRRRRAAQRTAATCGYQSGLTRWPRRRNARRRTPRRSSRPRCRRSSRCPVKRRRQNWTFLVLPSHYCTTTHAHSLQGCVKQPWQDSKQLMISPGPTLFQKPVTPSLTLEHVN
ncbi:PREDICTED: ankyrin repeat domain-containing protein 33B-like [Colobus angolensis palliatus]|uniref:ankyrin repeat domain-containing protein 33B-like n=1 Tax=Colobus angolensis palliatus TaxID=336983 RepID=UPI0005F3855C|nr:PREDICTED: ankyrin repeat domain-containing protein 33B-like [Colobus angolensis palliatus]